LTECDTLVAGVDPAWRCGAVTTVVVLSPNTNSGEALAQAASYLQTFDGALDAVVLATGPTGT
jgi:hypothetical protein